MRRPSLPLFTALGLIVFIVACEGADPRKIGEFCLEEADCESGLCKDSQCLNPDDDYDLDGLKNGIEKFITGTDYGLLDTDGDGVEDGVEVGADPNNPLDADGDGIHDALESALPSADPDMDCVPDQFDPDNNSMSSDMKKIADLHCSRAGVCGVWFEDVTATCQNGEAVCDYSAIEKFETVEASCDGQDNDCDGDTDLGLTAPEGQECRSDGVCAGNESKIFVMCRGGEWVCEYSAVNGFENIESSCDGIDNNCDGETDEGLVDLECFNRNEYGKCPGITDCDDYEGVMCVGPVPAPELCNGIDDNCNGETDENLTDLPCSRENEFGLCEGVTVCDMETGGTECSAPEPEMERCDLVDNDCDGLTDEEFICDRSATVMMTVFGATLPTVMLSIDNDQNRYAPLPGATVEFFMDTCPETDDAVPDWSGTTADDGSLTIPLQPGSWCMIVSAEGFQTMLANYIYLNEGDSVPLELLLLLNGMVQPQLSMCGRTVESPDYVTTISGSTDTEYQEIPVEGVNVSLTDAATETTIATTTSDKNGYWCLTGLPTLPGDSSLMLTGIRDGYYPETMSAWIEKNILGYSIIYMRELPVEETSCLYEGFEAGFDSPGWTTEVDSSPVIWNSMTSGTCIAQAYLAECSPPFANESDSQAPDTLLCADSQTFVNGCIPEPGSLASAPVGSGFAWFGNKETCSYDDVGDGCSVGNRVTGSLISPWLNGYEAWTLFMNFLSAWEIETAGSEVDVMYVEAQTSPQSEENLWTPVATVNELIPVETTTTVSRASAAGPYTSGGDASAPVWRKYEVDLSPFAGEWFRIRFRFDSMDGNSNFFRGWQIDEVNIRGIGCQSDQGYL